jgi:hypothetical protein
MGIGSMNMCEIGMKTQLGDYRSIHDRFHPEYGLTERDLWVKKKSYGYIIEYRSHMIFFQIFDSSFYNS